MNGRGRIPLSSSELVPRLFVVEDDLLVVFEVNRESSVVGERYDPATGEAARVAASGLEGRGGAAMVWTGEELLVVGGGNRLGIEHIGAAYDLAHDTWRPLPDPPGQVDAWANAITGPAVWTGTEMLIYREALAFDPASGEWRSIVSPPGPERLFEVTIWTGTELVVWGGCDASILQCDDLGRGIFTDGIAYDPPADEWRELAPSPLVPGIHPKGVWTGSEVLIYAGTASSEHGPTAAAYNPSTDTWRPLPDPPMAPRRYATAAWTGQLFVLWGGSRLGTEIEFGDGVAYDPKTNKWLILPPPPEGSERDRHAMVWVEDQIYITGGWRTNGPLVFKPGPETPSDTDIEASASLTSMQQDSANQPPSKSSTVKPVSASTPTKKENRSTRRPSMTRRPESSIRTNKPPELDVRIWANPISSCNPLRS